MSTKILVPTTITLKNFKKDPITALNSAKEGALAVFKNNIPIMYAVTPTLLNKLFSINHLFQEKKQEQIKHNIKENKFLEKIPIGKFIMYKEWKPDVDFLKQAAIWGIILHEPITHAELALFISYWQAEGRFFYHIQWQQKLARSIQQSRTLNLKYKKRDINDLPQPDINIPEGFRGQ
ncbi:primosomal protein DnaT [Buchnera aphidicola (Formosaphis micheliae)]|uniref:primosomal protein DnaT n=1 Tax=Buchnera aphidicola TaxID=9 RepID=UPI0031B89F83